MTNEQQLTRRRFLGNSSLAAAAMALGANNEKNYRTHRPRAKHVIYLHMAGSPPQLDLFDYKPLLQKHDGKPCPKELISNERFAFIKGTPKLLGTPFSFTRHGDSGAEVSELLPNIGRIADRLTFVKSMYTDQFNHAPAQLLLQTGSPRPGRPAIGAWTSYGLGSDNPDLPAYIVLTTGKHPSAGKSVWGSGFLPTLHQGVNLRSGRDAVLFLSNPEGMSRRGRRRSLDTLARLNHLQHERGQDPETLSRISQFELAYRMQESIPEAADLSSEHSSVLDMYGAKPGETSFANNCLLARRLVERGVRFVQLYDWGWDNHGTNPSDDMMHQLPKKCREVDAPLAALITDLERRGLLDETIVMWGGEFGRTPMNEKRNNSRYLGRDHHPHCFTMLMAGGGFKPGLSYGKTDDLGYFITENKVHVHDLQATVMHLLGVDHEKLTYRFQGRDYRLTDVAGHVVRDIIG